MALIKCPDCGTDVSNAAPACPSCGRPIATTPPALPPQQPKKKSLGIGCIIALVVGLGALAFLGLLAAIAIPNFIKARAASQQAGCIANLRTLEGAKLTWALENKKTEKDIPTEADLFGPTKYVKEKPTCPAGGIYTINPVGTVPTCTISGHEITATQ